MKKIVLLLFCYLYISANCLGQTSETFDIATFSPPKGWNKQASQDSVQFSTENKTSGAICLITLLKSVPGPGNSKENFDAAWQMLVKGAVGVSTAPQLHPMAKGDGWEVQMGTAPFEKDGTKGVVLLVTSSGYGQMVNAMILTNTQAYEQDIAAFLESISLKKPAGKVGAVKPAGPAQTAMPSAAANGYGFTTTKFDDGWTSTIQDDWVEVTKGTTRVLIHYPNKTADAYNSVLMESLKTAWNILVAPKYSAGGNFEFKPITGWQSIEFAEADMIEKGSGRTVHVVLFKMSYSNGTGRYLEFITASKAAFEQEFRPYDQKTSGWEKLERMANHNKFGITAADLVGRWTNDFSGSLSYVNAYTGAGAGTDTHASIENFVFGPGNTYKWDLGVASGMVGNIKFQSVRSSGRVSVPSIWQATFSYIEGKPRTYNAQFSAIKGARILWLDGRAFGKLQ